MIGAVIGDVVGSRFEFNNTKTKDFSLFTEFNCFTDDTVMTCAVAESLRRSFGGEFRNVSKIANETLREIGRKYPNCGYGAKFIKWMFSNNGAYFSCGNGSAMRVSSVGDVAKTVEEAIQLSHDVTCITHNHPEGLKGAESVAVAKVMLKNGKSKEEVKEYIKKNYYDVILSVSDYRRDIQGHGKEICRVTVPQAFACFFEGKDFEDVIRNCVSIGGDSDTIAAIAGGIAEAYYRIPDWMIQKTMSYLPLRLKNIIWDFEDFVDSLSESERDGEFDDEIRKLWEKFERIQYDPATECIEEPFAGFPIGTSRDDILDWFDGMYSGGLYGLTICNYF